MTEKQKFVPQTFTIQPDIYNRLKEKAGNENYSASYIVRQLIEKWLNDDISIN